MEITSRFCRLASRDESEEKGTVPPSGHQNLPALCKGLQEPRDKQFAQEINKCSCKHLFLRTYFEMQNALDSQKSGHFLVLNDLEWNVLQVGVDGVIQTLEGVISDEPDDPAYEKHILQARLDAALALRERLDRESPDALPEPTSAT